MNSPNSPKQDLNVSESSVQGSQLGQAGRDLNQIKAAIVNIVKKPINAAALALTAAVGVVGIIFAGKQNVITIHGNVGDGNRIANELTIYEGDPPEVRQRKLEQAKSLIAEEVLTNVSNLDTRLSYVGTALEKDGDFEQRLRDIRKQVAPSLESNFESGYNSLIRQQEISSLRNAFASRPLYGVREPLIQVLVDGNADAERVRAFYNSLTEVQDVSESLFQELSTAAAQTSTEPKVISHHEKRVKLAVERLINRSEVAHLSGLMVLDSLDIPLPSAQEGLSSLQHLEPRQLIGRREANQLLAAQLEEMERLVEERASIVEEAKGLLDESLNEYAKLNEELKIQASDPWNLVVAKAVSLRQLGRTPEAVAAFSRYADMFSKEDPTAKAYSRTAQQFTIQLKSLNVEGGVYLYEVLKDGIAEGAGLKAGDIITGYGSKAIINMNDIVIALQDAPTGDSIRLTYLRLSDDGAFQRQTVTVGSGSLGAGMMPI